MKLNLKCWQCFPREISKDENREVLKRRVILFNVVQRHIHVTYGFKYRDIEEEYGRTFHLFQSKDSFNDKNFIFRV